jgi:tRNA(Arg) A34 adenosine deaminase TadA
MRRAIELSVENVRVRRGGPFGCVIVKDRQIIAEGWNEVTSSNDPTAHAEVVAIRRACEKLQAFQLTECDLYTSCEPCPMCLGAIYWARPVRIYYAGTHKDAAQAGFDDSFIYQEMRLPVDQRHIPMTQLLNGEALAGFQEWQKTADKITY